MQQGQDRVVLVRHPPVENRFFQGLLNPSDYRTGRDVADLHDFLASDGTLELPQLVFLNDFENPLPQSIELLQVALDFTWLS